MKRLRTDDSGFTLIELIIVIVVMGVIAGILALMLVQGMEAFVSMAGRESLMTEAEAAVDMMTREIRNARSLNEVGAGIFRFTDVYGNDISYSADGGMLLRNGNLLAGRLKSLVFDYFDADGATVPGNGGESVRSVGIGLVLYEGRHEISVETRVRPRNL